MQLPSLLAGVMQGGMHSWALAWLGRCQWRWQGRCGPWLLLVLVLVLLLVLVLQVVVRLALARLRCRPQRCPLLPLPRQQRPVKTLPRPWQWWAGPARCTVGRW